LPDGFLVRWGLDNNLRTFEQRVDIVRVCHEPFNSVEPSMHRIDPESTERPQRDRLSCQLARIPGVVVRDPRSVDRDVVDMV
jgi:hypothetical protein